MHRHFILSILLFLWIFALVAPAVITLVERNPKSVVMNNLNEEEHQKHGKKNVGEKELAYNTFRNRDFLANQNEKIAYELSIVWPLDRALEILLPPPRYLN